MTGAPEMRMPGPRANTENRAEVSIRNDFPSIIAKPASEDDFAAIYIARRFGLALPVAQTIAALANLGRAFV